jgi:hypothetical protein
VRSGSTRLFTEPLANCMSSSHCEIVDSSWRLSFSA